MYEQARIQYKWCLVVDENRCNSIRLLRYDRVAERLDIGDEHVVGSLF